MSGPILILILALAWTLGACATHPPGDPWTRYHYASDRR